MHWFLVFWGLAAILFGADWLIKGSSGLARRFGWSEFIISVIIMGIGTNVPEIIIALASGARSMGELTITTNISSNIINILGFLGVAALIRPIQHIHGKRHLIDLVFLGFAAFVLMVMALSGLIGKTYGAILFGILAVYLIYSLYSPRNRIHYSQLARAKQKENSDKIPFIIMFLIVGIFMLYAGSQIFLDSLQKIATLYGINQTMLAILIVAPGTGFPELVITIMASLRGKAQMAIGNIVGSSLMKLTLVTAVGAMATDMHITEHIMRLDIWAMLIAIALLTYNILHSNQISRRTGFLFVCLLSGYFYLSIIYH